MNVKPLKKSQVTITGTIDGVYKARQQLLVSTNNFFFNMPNKKLDKNLLCAIVALEM